MMHLSNAAEIMHGAFSGQDQQFNSVSIDSRNIVPGALFFAIKGENQNGHQYVESALEQGAVAAVVDEKTFSDDHHIVVEDTTAALGQLAKAWRGRFAIPIIGITGSNGKTTVTAMVRNILAMEGDPLAPQKSFNNQWGVPLTLLRLNAQHTHGVIEMGMNHEAEIDYLTNIVCPSIALINNAAGAHLEGLGTIEKVASAKAEIINGLNEKGIVVLNADDAFHDFWAEYADAKGVYRFAINRDHCQVPSAEVDVYASEIELLQDRCRFTLHIKDQQQPVHLPVPGIHNIANALAAAAVSSLSGAGITSIVNGLDSFQNVDGRLNICRTQGGAQLIDDSFNANPASTVAAIKVLGNYDGRRIIVLGAMAELGPAGEQLHCQVGKVAAETGIDRLLVLTDSDNHHINGYQQGYGEQTELFDDVGSLATALELDNQAGTTILVKGSKSSAMGRVVEKLKMMSANDITINEVASC